MAISLQSQFSPSMSTTLSSYKAQGEERTPESASQDALISRLASNIPGMSASDLKDLNADDFTPEKVANRIGDFVAQGLEAARRSGRSEEDVQKMYDAAVKGVEKGFAEAKEILDNLNMLTETIETNIDSTFEKTFDRLTELDPSLAAENAAKSSTIERLTAAQRYDEAESLSLQVKTHDGDTVTINFSNQSRIEQSMGYESDGSNSQSIFNLSRSEESNYRFSVEGDLDDKEIDALQNLIKDVNEIAGEFFDGDVQKAFDMASEFQMDKTELSSMNLQLAQTKQYSAISNYSATQANSEVEAAGKRLGHLSNEFAALSQDPKLNFMQEIREFSEELLATLVSQDARYREADSEEQSIFDANLESLVSMANEEL
jgi:hypothetical protein